MSMDDKTKKGVLVAAIGWSPAYDQAPSSRALYLFNEIKGNFPETYLIMQDDGRGVKMDHLHLIRPIVAASGRLRLLKGVLYRLQASIYVLRFVRVHNVGVILLRGYDNAIITPFLKLMNVKIIYDFHGLEFGEHIDEKRFIRAFFTRHLENVMLSQAARILVISGGIREQISRMADKCLDLPNGIDMDRMVKANENVPFEVDGKKTLCFIGNWEFFMHLEDLCEAMKYLPNCEGIVIGWGKNAADIMKKYDAVKNLHFTGRLRPDVAYSLLKKCDIFVLPYSKDDKHSRIPDFYCSRKTKEYIAAGKPILVSDIVGKEKALINGVTSLYYVPGDPKDLAYKANLLIQDPALYEEIRHNVEALAPSLSWTSIIGRSGLIEAIALLRTQ